MAIALNSIETKDRIDVAGLGDLVKKQRPGLPFAFKGRADEYFGIWIVNLLLSVVTLGIYSAWAKVRTKRYFYGSTRLDGSSFAYLASPVQILKGRLIAFALFVAYAVCTTIWPTTIWPFLALVFLVTPWAMVRARAFNAYQSTYRNVRFGFAGRLGEAFKIYVLWPIASVLTLGLALPYTAYRADRFLVDNASYGRTGMSFSGAPAAYYRMYGMAFVIGFPAVLLMLALWAFSLAASYVTFGLDEAEAARAIEQLIGYFSVYLYASRDWLPYLVAAAVVLGIVATSYLTTQRQNYLFGNTRVGLHRLALDLNFGQVIWIRFSNLLAVALTAGLMIPWARIRMARYQIERMSLIPAGNLDTLVEEEQSQASAYGDELGEGMDLDLGLGV